MNIVNNYKKSGSVHRKSVLSRKRPVRCDDLIKRISELYLGDPKLSLRKIQSLVPASISTIRNIAREDLNLKPYKVPRSFQLLSTDYAKRLKLAGFFDSRRVNLETMFICSDEAFFYLHGGHNIQNDRIWGHFQPEEPVQQPLNDSKVMVWCAFSGNKVYGPYFFENTVNGETYLEMLKNFFWPRHLYYEKKQRYFFQQDGAPPHRCKLVQEWLKDKFGDRFLDSSKWPPRSPDLNPCDFSLWGDLKSKVYNPRPKTLQELKDNIEREIKIFSKTDLKSIFLNLKKRLVLLKQVNGRHFEHLL